VCVCEIYIYMHRKLKLLAAALPEQKDNRFLFENLVCFRVLELYVQQMFSLPRTESTANCYWIIISF
jgi:hypothetical protein